MKNESAVVQTEKQVEKLSWYKDPVVKVGQVKNNKWQRQKISSIRHKQKYYIDPIFVGTNL